MFASLFTSITTYIMIAVGVVYFVLGVLCMQPLYDRMKRDYDGKVREWNRKKKEEKNWTKENEKYRKYEDDRREGRGEWYDDLES